MAQQFNIQQVDPTNFETQKYENSDTSLLTSFNVSPTFDPTTDYINYFIYDSNNNLVVGFEDHPYKIYDNKVSIDPQQDIEEWSENYLQDGQYFTVYNFLTNLLASSPDQTYYISEISTDRTEIRLDTTTIPNADVVSSANTLASQVVNSSYYYDFYLNFGDNELVIANNIILDNTNLGNPTVLIKLYDPLPDQYDVKTTLWVVNKVAESVAYSLELTTTFLDSFVGSYIKGPNFNLELPNLQGNQTTTVNLDSLLKANTTTGSQSLTYQLNSILEEKGIELNIDYSDYQNFIHFSSAATRLENFYYKLSLIEEYSVSSSIGNNLNSYTSASSNIWQSKIDNIITNFDGYEYYLYYTSASTAWPKRNTQPPYSNYSITASQAITWLASQLTSASNYDESNYHSLVYAIPAYLREDPNNSQFELFVEMIGQHFDTLWTYTQQIPNKFDADNRLDYGVSKDLVADVLRDFGIKIYQNNFTTENLYSSLLGITPSGSLLNIPNTTLTLPAGTGLEYINSFVTASATSSLVPLDDANKEIYKRIYHNLPYLLKKKGTTAGLRALINLYGIPDTILRINEFGGKDRTNTDDWDNWQDTYNYSFRSTGSSNPNFFFATWGSFGSSTVAAVPSTIEFRFKTNGIPSQSFYSQSVASFRRTTPQTIPAVGLGLYYTGSGLTSGSYSGSIIDPQYQYGTLTWYSSSVSASISLPFFNGDWWSVMVTSTGTQHQLYAKQKGTYVGDNYIKYEASNSYDATTRLLPGVANQNIVLPCSGSTLPTFGGISHTPFQGSYQEVRLYSSSISESVFDDFVLNPYSIEENVIRPSAATLLFRAPLGTDLITYTSSVVVKSIHPTATGSVISQSFGNASSNYGLYTGSFSSLFFDPNQEFIYQDQPNAGIKIAISDKVKVGSQILPTGSTLSPYISIQQDLPISSSYTKDINYVEVGFSPQDEINDDIQDQLGFFNFGEYIGDPRQVSASNASYTDLNSLRDYYFRKYNRNYNTFDYIRLIKYLDNSLFKMIKDFVPARTGVATGVIVKQHILERNRYRPPQAQWENDLYTGSVATLSTGYDTGSVVYTFDGGAGGSLPTLTTITGSGLDSTISQSWSEVILTPLGTASIVHNNLEEFYTGEFEGTVITVTTGSLIDSDCAQFLDVDTTEVQYKPILYLYNGNASTTQTEFLSSNTTPSAGEILLYFISEQVQQGSPDSQKNALQQQSNRGITQ